MLDDLPIFKASGYPVFQLSPTEVAELDAIFQKMYRELSSDYAFKYDLIRNYVLELIHYGQKLQPATALYPTHNASARVSSLFIELLERQFPIESPRQKLGLRTAKIMRSASPSTSIISIKSSRRTPAKTTTGLISGRIAQEAKILLRQTDWNVSEIAYSLGFRKSGAFFQLLQKTDDPIPPGLQGISPADAARRPPRAPRNPCRRPRAAPRAPHPTAAPAPRKNI